MRIIEKFFDDLPSHIDYQTRDAAEADLAGIACGLGPTQFRAAADRLALLLNQDGDLPDDAERARRRYLTIDKQGVDGMSRIHGLLDPEARATVDAVFAKLAAPGMCNPDDETPCVDGEPSEEAVQGDARSAGAAQPRRAESHGPRVLASGELGQHNGLPATIIVSTTLQDLQSAAGVAVTGGGTLLPMRDVIRLASHSHHYLVIYDKHTRRAALLARTKRFASAGQRIVLHALDRGCTFPGCTVPGYGVKSTTPNWTGPDGGQTNITDDHPGLRAPQPPGRNRRLDHPKTQRRPHRMDPTTTPRHRPSPRQQLPPPGKIPLPEDREDDDDDDP